MIKDVDALLDRASRQPDLEVQSDYARYVAVRVCGLSEQAVVDIVTVYASTQSSLTVTSHIEKRASRGGVGSVSQILDLVGTFSKDMRKQLESELTESEKSALGSLRSQRHLIAHGGQSNVSLAQVREYFSEIRSLLTRVAAKF